jgi:hypothetical protein
MLVKSRIAEHKQAEADRIDKERERIRAEEAARLEREQAEAQARAHRIAAARAAVAAIRFPEPEPVVDVAKANPPAIPDTVLPVTPDASAGHLFKIAAAAFTAIKDSEKAEAIEPEVAQRLTKLVASLVAEEAVSSAKTSSNEAATVKLGAIGERLGFTLTEAFVSEVLGVQSYGKDTRAVLYRESDFPRICDALVRHIHKAKAGELSAA